MGKLTAIGMATFVTGLFMLVFKAIANIMNVSLTFPDQTLRNVMSPEYIDQIDAMSEGIIHTVANSLTTTPLYLGCIIIGVVVLLVGGLLNK